MTVSNSSTLIKNELVSLYIKDLKGIFDCTIDFDGPLVAIMGVNGIGKSTVLHALACSFRPASAGVDKRRFYEFFPPTTDKTWQNSSFSISILFDGKKPQIIDYCKATDRWSPRYSRQPLMNTYFIGIDTCCPEIERFKDKRASFTTTIRNDNTSQKIIEDACYILNKNYESILNNDFKRKNYIGVITKERIQYSSLSMGAGEQRVIKILELLRTVEPYSLILIDEIDLLLHSDALRKMIFKIYEIATKKNLKIVFTTHSLLMDELKDKVKIKYLEKNDVRTEVYNDISSLAWNRLDGSIRRPMTIYVEDELSGIIVKNIAKDLNVGSKIDIRKFGAIENAFTLASAMVIAGKTDDNTLIVLDGDRYVSNDDKEKQIEKKLSGTEHDADERRHKALNLISQFNLPENTAPEKYLFDILKNSSDCSEIVEFAKSIYSVSESHEWLDSIMRNTNCDYSDIISICKNTDKTLWDNYTDSIRKWISERMNL